MEYNVKNMVCARCIKTVTGIFQQAGAGIQNIGLGTVETGMELNNEQLNSIRQNLLAEGFELLDDQKTKLIEQIKNEIISLVHYGELDEMKEKLSVYLSEKLNKDYSQLSRLFSDVEGITIEQFFILQKIEKVKEWIAYDELTLSEIAHKLGYSSVAHLSSQFKKVTGFTPSHVKKHGTNNRKSLDKI